MQFYIYHIMNIPIHVRKLPSGDIAIWHPYNEQARLIVETICRNRGRWNGQYNNWIVFSIYKQQVLIALENAKGNPYDYF